MNKATTTKMQETNKEEKSTFFRVKHPSGHTRDRTIWLWKPIFDCCSCANDSLRLRLGVSYRPCIKVLRVLQKIERHFTWFGQFGCWSFGAIVTEATTSHSHYPFRVLAVVIHVAGSFLVQCRRMSHNFGRTSYFYVSYGSFICGGQFTTIKPLGHIATLFRCDNYKCNHNNNNSKNSRKPECKKTTPNPKKVCGQMDTIKITMFTWVIRFMAEHVHRAHISNKSIALSRYASNKFAAANEKVRHSRKSRTSSRVTVRSVSLKPPAHSPARHRANVITCATRTAENSPKVKRNGRTQN